MKAKNTFLLVLMTVLVPVTSACGGGVVATDVPAGAGTESPAALSSLRMI